MSEDSLGQVHVQPCVPCYAVRDLFCEHERLLEVQDEVADFCFRNFILNAGIDVRVKTWMAERALRGHCDRPCDRKDQGRNLQW